jgi:hypothetical protein
MALQVRRLALQPRAADIDQALRDVLHDNACGNDVIDSLLASNGIINLEVQTVKVEYLKPSEYLILPQALLDVPMRVADIDAMNAAAVRDIIGAKCVHPRDVGMLRNDQHRFRDEFRNDYMPVQRFQLETLIMIAAMNYKVVGDSALYAYTRAFGVGLGLLPIDGSILSKEFHLTNRKPIPDAVKTIQAYISKPEIMDYLPGAVALILARHGIEHLVHDHTYKAIDESFVRRFETIVAGSALSEGMKSDIRSKMPLVCRTVAHPFGMASLLSFAYAAKRAEFLPANLALRLPPVHNSYYAYKVIAAGWSAILSLPVGQLFDSLYGPDVDSIKAQILLVEEAPWRYSPLCKYYGHVNRVSATPEGASALEVIKPIVVGYLLAFAPNSSLAKAYVVKKSKTAGSAAVGNWEVAFTQYANSLSKTGLTDMIATARRALAAPVAQQALPAPAQAPP